MKIFVDADGPAKRTPEDDARFEESFEKMIQKAMEYIFSVRK